MREKIAALEHEQWIQWAKTLIEKEELSLERINRWKQLFVPYSELSEEMKDFDREWADKVLSLPSGYIAGENEITIEMALKMFGDIITDYPSYPHIGFYGGRRISHDRA